MDTKMTLKEWGHLHEELIKKFPVGDPGPRPRLRTKKIKLPEGFHDCGDPLCGYRELIRVEREKDRVRKRKTSPSGR